ncbi:MAG: hypothetical protein V3S26_02045 [Acidimicrobiia bacterium]
MVTYHRYPIVEVVAAGTGDNLGRSRFQRVGPERQRRQVLDETPQVGVLMDQQSDPVKFDVLKTDKFGLENQRVLMIRTDPGVRPSGLGLTPTDLADKGPV